MSGCEVERFSLGINDQTDTMIVGAAHENQSVDGACFVCGHPTYRDRYPGCMIGHYDCRRGKPAA